MTQVSRKDEVSEYYHMKEERSGFDSSFEKHDVEYEEVESQISGKLIRWRWAEPDKYMCSATFTIQGSVLIVTGDYGEATYNWYSGGVISPEFLMDCHEHYIHGKCTASSRGRKFVSFNENVLKKYLDDHKKQVIDSAVENGYYTRTDEFAPEKIEWDEEQEFEEEFINRIKPIIDEDYEEVLRHSDMHEWNEFLRSDGERFFGDDWWEFAGDIAEGPDIHFICQMECLKRSLKRLKEKGYV